MRPTLVSFPATHLRFAALVLVWLLPIFSLSSAVRSVHYRRNGGAFGVEYTSDPQITSGPALSHFHQSAETNDDPHDFIDLEKRKMDEDGEDDSGSGPPATLSTRSILTRTSKPAPTSTSTSTDSVATSNIGALTFSSTKTVGTEIVVDTPTPSPKPLPHPFDTNRGNNFTSTTCPDFFDDFLGDKTFKECHPISLLLRNSRSFFEATKSFVETTQSLDRSCAAPKEKCSSLLTSYSEKITTDDGCSEEIKDGNPLVVQASNGFMAYSFVRDAACLKNPDTHNYCLADAVSNSTNPADYYIYYLSLGLSLPGSSRPACSKCLQATMEIFLEAAKDKDQALHDTYASAAEQINIGCGPSFVGTAEPDSTGAGLKPRVNLHLLFSLIGYSLLFSGGISYIV